jgi:hypothetical protein
LKTSDKESEMERWGEKKIIIMLKKLYTYICYVNVCILYIKISYIVNLLLSSNIDYILLVNKKKYTSQALYKLVYESNRVESNLLRLIFKPKFMFTKHLT